MAYIHVVEIFVMLIVFFAKHKIMEICFIIHVLIIVGFDMMVKIQSRSKSKGIQ